MPADTTHASLIPVSSILKHVEVDPSHLRADRQQLAIIVADLHRCGGRYTPRVNWVVFPGRIPEEVDDGRPYLDEGFSDDAIANRMSTMAQMLEPWIGHQRRPAAAVVERYAPYLTAHDPLNLWATNVARTDVLARLLEADVGSILDLNIVYSHSDSVRDGPHRILEIGGGYGRLAEAFLNVFGKGIKYVLVDSVPASLLYARDYLRRACPWARVGFYYDGDPFDLEAFDCYIVPSWHFEAVNESEYDSCINIESFQEMGQDQVDTYLSSFHDVAREGALIYLSNAHDYRFRGEWNYPVTWQRLLCSKTPRSWTSDHRTEVFIKGDRDNSVANAAIVAAYKWNVAQEPSSVARWIGRSPKTNANALLHRARDLISR